MTDTARMMTRREAADRLYRLARMRSGASSGATRIILGCADGETQFSIGDIRKLDPENRDAALTLLHHAIHVGCEDSLEIEKREQLLSLLKDG